MEWTFNDGGREAAGFKGLAGDCVCRSIAIATGKPYREVYRELNRLAKNERITARKPKRSSARNGVYRRLYHRYLTDILEWQWVPTSGSAPVASVHLCVAELPDCPRLIVRLSRHLTAVVDGVIQDTYDPSRNGTRRVYGYYHKPNP